MAPRNHAEDAILAFLATLSKLAQSSDRYMVRDAGAIGALVAFMISGTGEVPARAATVLRDLAQYPANRTAILEAGGIAQLVKMLHSSDGAAGDAKVIATEAADALRCLCAGNLPVVTAIRENNGIKSLVALLRDGPHSAAAPVAAAALAHISQADPQSRRDIVDADGVKTLAKLLKTGVKSDSAGGRKRGETANWCEGRACEETARVLHELVAHGDAALHKLCREQGLVPSLMMLILRAGAQAPSASLAAAILVVLVDKEGGSEEHALNEVVMTLVEARRDECAQHSDDTATPPCCTTAAPA